MQCFFYEQKGLKGEKNYDAKSNLINRGFLKHRLGNKFATFVRQKSVMKGAGRCLRHMLGRLVSSKET